MKTVAVLLVSLLAGSSLSAQSPTPRSSTDTTITPTHLAAAEQLLEVSDTEKGIRDGMRAYFDAQSQQNPLMVPYRPVMEAFAAKYLVWSDLKPRLARIYAQALTEEQLLVQDQLQAHAPELQQMIQAKAAELDKPGAAAPPKKPR